MEARFAHRLLPWCGDRSLSEVQYGIGLCNLTQFAEIGRVLEVLESDDQNPAAVYERQVIHAMLSDDSEPLYQRSVFSLLVLRHAFTSEWLRNNVDPADTQDVIRTILLAFGGAYQRDINDVAGETAVLRFAYELTVKFPDKDFCPTYLLTISPELMGASPGDGPTYDTRPFKDYNLNELIRNNPERVEELLALAMSHGTTDSAVLSRLLISPATPLPLNEGII